MTPRPTRRWLGTAAAVIVYALAMAYLESATVVYLRQALDAGTGDVFPLDMAAPNAGLLGWVELGREGATLVMIATVGWIAGRGPVDRLAWAAVVFGVWDIGYYAWLWVFSGWPTGLGTWDLLFLIPLPWAGPVWAPVAVSAALIGFGLAMARIIAGGGHARLTAWQAAGLAAGGLIIIGSFLANAVPVLNGELPTWFPWPVFWGGMAIGFVAAIAALRAAGTLSGATAEQLPG